MTRDAGARHVQTIRAVRRPLGRVVALVAAVASLDACFTRYPVTSTPDDEVSLGRIPHAVVVLSDGAEIALRDVEVRGDSVVGYTESRGVRRGVDRAAVERVDRRDVRPWSTSALVFGAGLAAFTVWLAVVLQSCCGPGS